MKVFYPLIMLVSTAISLYAQTIHFVHYGTESGLPQSQVQTIEQDRHGNLWLGTLSGLTRYNGKEFVTFSKLDGLAEDWITTSYKDKSGNIWFGHWTGGISKYNIETKTFETIALEEFLEFRSVSSFIEDHDGNLWIGTYGSGVIKYESKTNKVLLINRINGLSSNNVTCIMQDSYHNIWFGTDLGITVYNTASDMGSSEAFAYISDQNGLPGNFINDICQVLGTQVWVSVEGHGLIAFKVTEQFSFNTLDKVPRNIIIGKNNPLSSFISRIYTDSRNSIWLATADTGIILFAPEPGRENAFPTPGTFRNYNASHGLNYNRVNDIFEDREENIWIATDLGLNRYRGEQFQLFDEDFGIANNIVWAVYADSRGDVWLGTNSGATRLTAGDGQAGKKYRTLNYSVKDGLAGNSIRAVFEDASGNIWFGTAGGGVGCWNPKTDRFSSLSEKDGLADNTVLTISEDPSGNLWFGTPRGGSKYDPPTRKFTNYSSISGLGGNSVFRIFRDSKGNLWLGSLGGSLTLYANQKFTTFNENHGLFHKFILSITEDRQGNIWFGTYGGGLYRYSPDQEGKVRFVNYSRESGLSTQTPYSIICDDKNNLWIGTSNGIDRFDQKTNVFTHFGRTEGFLGIENNANAIAIDKNYNIWFGTIMGALRFDPHIDKSNTVEPVTAISRIRIMQKDTVLPPQSVLSYDHNTVSFYFIGVCLTNSAKVRYKYRLHGFYDEWSQPTAEGFVTFSNLPHGHYTFELLASNDAGIWNKEPVTTSFSITPPFWFTWWFYVSVTVFLVAVIYVFIRIRERNLIYEKRRLESIVQQRTRELAQKNRELAEMNRDITDSITYAKKIQEAMLPTEEYWKKVLPDSFILHMPKAIVSGDFYWLCLPPSDATGNIVLFAACDCTGHGVPGAFMSMLCSSLMNEAVNEKKLVQPSTIFDEVRRGVISTLKQRGEYGESQDGMDGALCCLLPSGRGCMRLMSACANNPVWVIRPLQNGKAPAESPVAVKYKNDKFQLFELPPDRQPVAISSNITPFSHYEIELYDGDVVYMFSDGIEDQFGGPDGKKFKATRLRDLLMTISDKPMKEQQQIIQKTIRDWMGKFEQLDDILMVGVRV